MSDGTQGKTGSREQGQVGSAGLAACGKELLWALPKLVDIKDLRQSLSTCLLPPSAAAAQQQSSRYTILSSSAQVDG